jgi:hypothetical protein
MNVLAIDPGPVESAFVLYDGARILDHGHVSNIALLNRLKQRSFNSDITVIEQIEGMGIQAGASIFETCFWSGRFAQASKPFDRIKRKAIKRHLCGRVNTKDQDVRAALITRFGGGFPAGFTGHRFAALAVAVTWMDQQQTKAGHLWDSSDCSTSTKSASS